MADEPEISDKLQIVIGSLISLLLAGTYLLFSGSLSSSSDPLTPVVTGEEPTITGSSILDASSDQPNQPEVQVRENETVTTPFSKEVESAAMSSSQSASAQSTRSQTKGAQPKVEGSTHSAL